MRYLNTPARRIVALVLVAIVATGSGIFWASTARAANFIGMDFNDGYYAQNDVLNVGRNRFGAYIFEEGIVKNWQINPVTKQAFIDTMRKRLDGAEVGTKEPANTQKARAAALVNIMLGQDGSAFGGSWQNGVTYANANWARWVALVDLYDNAWTNNLKTSDGTRWGVNFNDFYSTPDSTDILGLTDGNGDKLYGPTPDNGRLPDLVYMHLGGVISNEEVVGFHNPDGSILSLLKKCANLIGDPHPLQTPVVPTPPPTPAPTPPAPPPIRPYVEINGGDVVAGASFATTNPTTVPCGTAPHRDDAGIVAWNKRGAPDYSGGGAMYAAYVLNHVQDFVTGQGNGRVTLGQEKNELTFSNADYDDSVNLSAGQFGGMFETAPCIDMWSNQPTGTVLSTDSLDVNTLDSGVYKRTGNLSLTPTTISAGKHITIYVNGDVDIGGPDVDAANDSASFVYNTSGWTSRDKIPSFTLIVHGVIYINHHITKLDGTYVAVPDTGYNDPTTVVGKPSTLSTPKAGTISTCSTGFQNVDPLFPEFDREISDCRRQLVVYGSFMAQQIWLLRNYGDIGGEPAEIFNYAPEVWLAPNGKPKGSISSEYQSIISLPPTL